ncbi:MAG: AGE family epimerase/isomerase [Clostridia bacterium]
MNKELLKQQQLWIQEELKRCVEFWLKNGWDKKNGGVYTCLDREGKIYSTDKSVWMQGRCAWTFSYLCHCYGVKQEWLDMAKSCLDFMEAHCINREKGNRMYFTVTAEGKPLRQRRYNFSEGFYTLANAEYGALVHDDTYLQRARDTFEMIWKLNHGLMEDPVGMGPKTISETRKGRSLGNPMIYLNICSIMRRCDPKNVALYDERSKQCIDDIFRYHHKPEMHCTLETVGMNGEVMDDVTEGRVVNPGHDIECSWFLMEYAKYSKDSELLKNACEVFNNAIDAGWDSEYEGLLYFIDCKGLPTEAYEHDMKLWWPHNEILIASLMAYRDTGDERYYEWYTKTLEYCKRVFSDPQYGEWYGYLRRDGKPTMPSTKGSTFKGPFHLPRMLIMTDQMITEMLK